MYDCIQHNVYYTTLQYVIGQRLLVLLGRGGGRGQAGSRENDKGRKKRGKKSELSAKRQGEE